MSEPAPKTQIDIEEFERRLRAATTGRGQDDPLAELARLVGRDERRTPAAMSDDEEAFLAELTSLAAKPTRAAPPAPPVAPQPVKPLPSATIHELARPEPARPAPRLEPAAHERAPVADPAPRPAPAVVVAAPPPLAPAAPAAVSPPSPAATHVEPEAPAPAMELRGAIVEDAAPEAYAEPAPELHLPRAEPIVVAPVEPVATASFSPTVRAAAAPTQTWDADASIHAAPAAPPAPRDLDEGVALPPLAPVEPEPALQAVEAADESEAPTRSRKGLILVAGLVGFGVVAAGAAIGLKGMGVVAPKDPPTIQAGAAPIKVQPPASDATQTSGQSASVLDRKSDSPAAAKVVSREEQPVDLSRQAPRIVRTTPVAGAPVAGASPLTAAPGANPQGAFPEPRKVRTVTVRPDGSLLGAPSQTGAPAIVSSIPSPSPAPAVAVPPAPPPVVSAGAPPQVVPAPSPANPAAAAAPATPAARPQIAAAPPAPKVEAPAAETPKPAQAAPATPAVKTTSRVAPNAPAPATTGAPAKPRSVAAAPAPRSVAAEPEAATDEPVEEVKLPFGRRTASVAPATDAPAATGATQPANAPRAAASTGGDFAVQLVAAPSEQEAKETASRLRSRYSAQLSGHSPGVRKAEVGGKTVYRVRVGGMSRDEATALCARLQSAGGSCFVARN